MDKDNQKIEYKDGQVQKVKMEQIIIWNNGLSLLLDELNLDLDVQWKIAMLKTELEEQSKAYRKLKQKVDKKHDCKVINGPLGPVTNPPEDPQKRQEWEEDIEKINQKEVNFTITRFSMKDFQGVKDSEGKLQKPKIQPRFFILMNNLIDK